MNRITTVLMQWYEGNTPKNSGYYLVTYEKNLKAKNRSVTELYYSSDIHGNWFNNHVDLYPRALKIIAFMHMPKVFTMDQKHD